MDFKLVTLPIRVLIASSNYTLDEWFNLYSDYLLRGDQKICNIIKIACNKIGLHYSLNDNIQLIFNSNHNFKVKNEKKFIFAKLKHNF